MADSTPSLIWMCDEQGKVVYLNEQWVVFTGLDRSAGHGHMWADRVSQMYQILFQRHREAASHFQMSPAFIVETESTAGCWSPSTK